MQLVHSDRVFGVAAGTLPNYRENNPILRLTGILETEVLSGDREHYIARSLQYLVPFNQLDLYGPSAPNSGVIDPARQDDKTDFQKQNLAGFVTTSMRATRGWASAGSWTGPFVRLSYTAGPDTPLAQAAGSKLRDSIRIWLKVGQNITPSPIKVPYRPETDRYELEIWGYPFGDLRQQLGPKGQDSYDRGTLIADPVLVPGNMLDFARENLDGRFMGNVAPNNAMHPILPLRIEAAFADASASVWDSNGGTNYRLEFSMVQRGWENYLGVGVSPNPHGGVGFLHYRNLLSNYGAYAGSKELGREVDPWMFDAHGNKPSAALWEDFMTVNYMDLHLLKKSCGIGLHRHRDNSEVFLMMQGEALMVIGDWAQQPNRDRCFEVRTLTAGHLAMLRGGQLHGLVNSTDEDISLFMFGGYD